MSHMFSKVARSSRCLRTLCAFERFVNHMRSFVYFQEVHSSALVWTLVAFEREYILMDTPENSFKRDYFVMSDGKYEQNPMQHGELH